MTSMCAPAGLYIVMMVITVSFSNADI